MNSFMSTADLNRSELDGLIDSAVRFKRGDDRSKSLAGKSIALVFLNPSLRTRASMQVGIYELGGNAVVLEPGSTSWTLEHREGAVMDADNAEHIKEFVRVLERYCSAIGVRTFAQVKDWAQERQDPVLNSFARYATKPIINLESAMHHPCQSLADMMTIRERFGSNRKRVLLTWAWHPKPLPMAVPNSFALAAAQMGHALIVAHPPGYELDESLMTLIQSAAIENGGSVEITNEIDDAFSDVDVVYAKSWGAKHFYGNPEQEVIAKSKYRKLWIVDEQRMSRTNEAIFMHCLPVRRNVIVTDAVLDGPTSSVIDQAENRLHVQKAILKHLSG
ncbi:MAG: N-acetylornithine carbamoyltransferase [Pyrinomonadaceae bacterium]